MNTTNAKHSLARTTRWHTMPELVLGLRGLREVLGLKPDGIDTGRHCPTCSERIYRAAADTNDPTCSSPRCRELRGKVEVVSGLESELPRMNAAKLSEIQATSGLRIHPNRWAHWRPTREVAGEVRGIGYAICLASDGNVAWFKRLGRICDAQVGTTPSAPPAYFLGHTQRFEWQDAEGAMQVGCPPGFFSKDKGPRAVRPKKKKKTKMEELEELLGI